MEVKPGYKQTEVGVIPEEWLPVSLVDVSERISVGLATSVTQHYRHEGVQIVRNLNIKDGFFDGSDILYVSEDFAAANVSKAARALDVLTVRTGSNLGLTCVLPAAFNGCQTFTTLITTPKQEILDSDYLCRQMSSFLGKAEMGRLEVGGGKGNLNTGNLKNYRLSVPPLPEQRAIATALSDVDGLLGRLDRLIAKKRDLKQAAMQQLLTGQTRLPGFHGEWEVKTFGKIAVPRRERIDPRRTGVHDFCIELEHIESGSGQILGSTSTGTQSSLKSVFHPGDVLFGKLRAYLRKYWRATRQGVCSTEIWVLVPRVDAAASEFLFQIVQTDDFIDAASNSYGTHMPRSDWNAVQNHELKMPPIPEQTAIAEVLTEMDGELAVLEKRWEKTRALKQAMMQELLTGRIRLVASSGATE